MLTKISLNIKVETINLSVLRCACIERTRAIPVGIIRTESLVQEVGKVLSIISSGNFVVAGHGVVHATDAEEDLHALVPTVVDVLLHVVAFAEKLRVDIVGVLVGSLPAVAGEVGAWVVGRIILRGLVDESQSDILDATVTVCTKTLIARLTL